MSCWFVFFLCIILTTKSTNTDTPLFTWLTTHRLQHHHSSFLQHGFDTISDVKYMNTEDIEHIGINKRGEQKRALRAITQLLQPESASTQSLYNLLLTPFNEFFWPSWIVLHWTFTLLALFLFGLVIELVVYNFGCLNKCTQLYHSCNPCNSQSIVHVPRDYSTIEKAVEKAQQLNGAIEIIRVAAGKYILQKDLVIDFKSGIKISGAGMGKTTLVGVVIVKKTRDIELDNLSIMSGYKPTKGKNKGCGLRVENGGSAIVTRCEVKCCRGCGVEVRESSYLSMIAIGSGTRCTITNLESYHNERCGLSAMDGAIVDIQGKRTNIHDNDGPGLSATGAGATIRINLPRAISWNKDGGNGRSLSEKVKKEGKEDGDILYEDGGSVHRSIE